MCPQRLLISNAIDWLVIMYAQISTTFIYIT
jgi:hypothetical protein